MYAKLASERIGSFWLVTRRTRDFSARQGRTARRRAPRACLPCRRTPLRVRLGEPDVG